VPAITPMMDALRQDMRRNDRADRQAAVIRAIGQIPGPEALNALAEVLTAADAWPVKQQAVAQLGRRGAEGVAALTRHLEREQDFRIRGSILKILGEEGTADAMALVARLARNDPDMNVRRAAVRALGKSKDPEAVRTLQDLARASDDMSLRQSAIQAYAAAAGAESVLVLSDLVRADPNIRVRSVAVMGLQMVGGNGVDEAVSVLRQVADDPSQTEDIRARARGALAAIERQRAGGGQQPQGEIPLKSPLTPMGGNNLGPLKPVGQDR